MTIIPVDIEDLDELQSIGIQSYKDHYRNIWTPEGLQNFLHFHFGFENLMHQFSDQNTKYFLGKDLNKSIGFIKLKLDSPLPIDNLKEGLELEKIYFLQDFVGKGFGSQMMQFVIQYASKKDNPFIWLDVLKSNTLAKSFYEKYDFKVVGEIPFSTDIINIGMWVMCKSF